MKLQEIKDAVNAGKTVNYASALYTVLKDNKGQWLLKSGSHYIGLTWADGVTLNGEEDKFFIPQEIAEHAEKPKFEISWKRVNNDVNGNPRYVCHFLNFLKDGERGYELALQRSRALGGRKFHNKQYGGGIVFQSYNINDLTESINELVNGK